MSFLKKVAIEILVYLGILVLTILTAALSGISGLYLFTEYLLPFIP